MNSQTQTLPAGLPANPVASTQPGGVAKKARKPVTPEGKEILKQNTSSQKARDLKIFRYLAAGCATTAQIHYSCFRNETGKLLDRSVCDRRLRKLCANEYIRKRKYNRSSRSGPIHVYAIGDAAKNDFVNNYHASRDQIRGDLPPIATIMHELHLSEFIRTIWKEVDEKKYSIGWQYDDRQMKRMRDSKRLAEITTGLSVNKKGRYFYPDLRVRVLPNHREQFDINIELDTGHKGESYWVRKLQSWGQTTLVLAPVSSRLETLKEFIRAYGRPGKTLFALSGDFAKNGLAGTIWHWLPDDTKGRLPIS